MSEFFSTEFRQNGFISPTGKIGATISLPKKKKFTPDNCVAQIVTLFLPHIDVQISQKEFDKIQLELLQILSCFQNQ